MVKQMSMKERIELYIQHRHCLGYHCGELEKILLKFADYVDHRGYTGPLKTNWVIEWILTSGKNNAGVTWINKLLIIRGFAKFYHAIEPKTEIPPAHFFGSMKHKRSPYIYSQKEIQDLLIATNQLKPIDGIKPITFKYLLGLMASTGIRISEAIKLTVGDVNLEEGFLVIFETKNHKSRYVLLHPSTQDALKEYIILRDKYASRSSDSCFFVLDNNRQLELIPTERDFRWLCQQLGWGKKPRLHDLRHTFTCQRLLKWYQEGKDVDSLIVYLSTYLGHAHITETYWYITAIPELMAIVSNRFEKYCCSENGG